MEEAFATVGGITAFVVGCSAVASAIWMLFKLCEKLALLEACATDLVYRVENLNREARARRWDV